MGPRMQKVLEGDLARVEVPDLLTFLNMGRRTGVLALECVDLETKIFFREGRTVFATSTRDELRLGSMLVRMGKVKPEVMDRVLARPKAPGRIGHALLAENVLSEAELASFLKVQVSEVIFDTFAWRAGVFSFWDGVPPPATAVTLDMDLQNLLMEGVRRIDERHRLSEVFPDLDMAVEAVANPERVKHSVTLTPDEWKAFFLVDGRRSLAEICRLAGNPDELATLQILHNLVLAKFVAVGPAIPAPAADMASVDPRGTHKLQDGQPAPPSAPVAVEFASVARPRPEDDTKEIVTPKAVQYLGHVGQVTVSHLVLDVAGKETSFPLNRDSYTLGRHRNNDIVISDPKVSSFHARLDRSPQGFVLVDLKSRNGSFVNGQRIDSAQLDTGDEVRLGTARLAYKVDYISSS
jgi:uncharacterized protein DUF4388/FHA domain-containing protein